MGGTCVASSSSSTFCIRPSGLFQSELLCNYGSRPVLGRVINSVASSTLTQKKRRQTSKPRVGFETTSENKSCLRSRGHCDRRVMNLNKNKKCKRKFWLENHVSKDQLDFQHKSLDNNRMNVK
jgi:hypothetical protein